MSRLEQLGLGVAASVWMETPFTEGRLLAHFIAAAGQVLDYRVLDQAIRQPVRVRGPQRIESDEHGHSRVRAYLCRLRAALADLGHGDAIETIPSRGYRMPAERGQQLRALIEATA